MYTNHRRIHVLTWKQTHQPIPIHIGLRTYMDFYIGMVIYCHYVRKKLTIKFLICFQQVLSRKHFCPLVQNWQKNLNRSWGLDWTSRFLESLPWAVPWWEMQYPPPSAHFPTFYTLPSNTAETFPASYCHSSCPLVTCGWTPCSFLSRVLPVPLWQRLAWTLAKTLSKMETKFYLFVCIVSSTSYLLVHKPN